MSSTPFSWLPVFLRPPDKQKSFQAFLVYAVSLTWVGVVAVAVPICMLWIPQFSNRIMLALAFVSVIAVLCLSFNYWDYIKEAAYALPLALWVSISFFSYTAGGVNAPTTALFLPVILMTGFLLGNRWALLMAVLSAAIVLSFVYLERIDKLPVPMVPHTAASRWLTYLMAVANAMAIQYFATNHLRSSLQMMEQEKEERSKAEREKKKVSRQLVERNKELKTLYNVGQILQMDHEPLPEVLQSFIDLLPAGWQYPQVTVARVCIGIKQYQTAGYRTGLHSLVAEFTIADKTKGFIEVTYLVDKPILDEGPFLVEERALIDMLAKMLKTYLDRRHSREAMIKSQLNLS